MHVRSESESLEDAWNSMYFSLDPNETAKLYDAVLDVIVLADQAIEALRERILELENQLEAAVNDGDISKKNPERKK